MLLPELIAIKSHDSDCHIKTLSLNIPSQLAFFAGHFSGLPILPGVVQIHWVVHFAQEYFNLHGSFTRLENIKFHSVILPDTQMELSLQWDDEKSSLDFAYANNDKTYAAGRLVFKTS